MHQIYNFLIWFIISLVSIIFFFDVVHNPFIRAFIIAFIIAFLGVKGEK